ncbi:efflux RND transporter periplasmic adaptor subunit [bacterium]|nr:efflux RND transporter periplasmic adaptor subunit [bacterium]
MSPMTSTPQGALDLRGLSLGEQTASADQGPKPLAPPRRILTRVVIPCALLAGFVGLAAYALRDTVSPASGVRVVPVVTGRPGASSGAAATPLFQAAGWVEPEPFPILVPALTTGIVSSVTVLEGDPVRAGQVVATLISIDAELERDRAASDVSVKRGKLGEAEAVLEAARTTWEQPIALDRDVAADAAEVRRVEAELARLDAETEKARAAERIEAEEVRLEKFLLETGGAGPRGLEIAEQKLRAASAEVAAIASSRPVLEASLAGAMARAKASARERELRIADRQRLASAEASVLSARGELGVARTVLAEAELKLTRTQVVSPANGFVLRRNVSPGESVLSLGREGAPVVALYDPEHLRVRVDVPLATVGGVHIGQRAEVTFDTWKGRVFPGRVVRTLHYADIQKNTLGVHVVFDPPAPAKPDMLAQVRFLDDEKPATGPAGPARPRMFVPGDLVQQDDAGSFVLEVDVLAGRLHRKSVKVGPRAADGTVEVQEGLTESSKLVRPASGLRDGARVRVVGED